MDYLNKHWRSEELHKANEWHYVKDKLPPVKKEYNYDIKRTKEGC